MTDLLQQTIDEIRDLNRATTLRVLGQYVLDDVSDDCLSTRDKVIAEYYGAVGLRDMSLSDLHDDLIQRIGLDADDFDPDYVSLYKERLESIIKDPEAWAYLVNEEPSDHIATILEILPWYLNNSVLTVAPEPDKNAILLRGALEDLLKTFPKQT